MPANRDPTVSTSARVDRLVRLGFARRQHVGDVVERLPHAQRDVLVAALERLLADRDGALSGTVMLDARGLQQPDERLGDARDVADGSGPAGMGGRGRGRAAAFHRTAGLLGGRGGEAGEADDPADGLAPRARLGAGLGHALDRELVAAAPVALGARAQGLAGADDVAVDGADLAPALVRDDAVVAVHAPRPHRVGVQRGSAERAEHGTGGLPAGDLDVAALDAGLAVAADGHVEVLLL